MARFSAVHLAVAVVLAASGCDPAVPEPGPSTPPPTPAVLLDRCPVTRGSDRVEPLPTSLPVGSTAHWYGTGPLWADLSLITDLERRPVGPEGTTYRVRWKAFVDGELTAQVSRLDAPGAGRARAFPASAEGHAFWTGEVWLPTAGCWRVTATVSGISLSFVMRSW